MIRRLWLVFAQGFVVVAAALFAYARCPKATACSMRPPKPER